MNFSYNGKVILYTSFPSFEGPTAKANGLSENDISVRVNGDDATGKAIMSSLTDMSKHSCMCFSSLLAAMRLDYFSRRLTHDLHRPCTQSHRALHFTLFTSRDLNATFAEDQNFL